MNNYDSAYDELPECCCDGMEENEKLKRENAELMAMVNELRDSFNPNGKYSTIGVDGALLIPVGVYNEWVSVLNKAQSQSLNDHDMRIAEAVREALVKYLFHGLKGCSNHSCVIEKPKGMGTNGSCHCLQDRTKAQIISGRLSAIRHLDLTHITHGTEDAPK